jgi:acetyl esterase/lipase
MKHFAFLYVAFTLIPRAAGAAEPEVVPLWAGGAPGFEDRRQEPEQAADYWVKNIHNPSLTVFLPPADKATGGAIVICPGGGHRELVFDAEGRDAAEFLNGLGVAALVLKYRLAREEGSPYSLSEHIPQDGRRAMRLTRSRAADWGIDPLRIGMLGFSAGGEVVSMIAYDDAPGDPTATDPVERENGRPDFQILVYPGPLGIPETVPTNAPPALLIVANDDRGHVEPVVELLAKYRAARAPIEVHLYALGGHAFNMGLRTDLKTLQHWPDRMADWLADNGWLSPRP